VAPIETAPHQIRNCFAQRHLPTAGELLRSSDYIVIKIQRGAHGDLMMSVSGFDVNILL